MPASCINPEIEIHTTQPKKLSGQTPFLFRKEKANKIVCTKSFLFVVLHFDKFALA